MNVVDKTFRKIRSYKILGAEKIAEAAIVAWNKAEDKRYAEEKLSKARPTEPMLRNVLKYLSVYGNAKELLVNLKLDIKKIAKIGAKKIRDGMIVFTHCHSSTVESILKEAKREGKKFEVYVTETRPLYQGRTTAKNLAKARIPVTLFIDSAARLALKKADIMLIGADAITSEGIVINKIGSELFANIANKYEVPVYSCTHSWKFDAGTVFGFEEKIEKLMKRKIWTKPPRRVKINSYAFERIKPDVISGIISELGIYKPEVFVEEVKKNYEWMFK